MPKATGDIPPQRRSAYPVDRMRVDERYWPKGASELVLGFLRDEYDPATMPQLIVVTIEGSDGLYSVIGWDTDDEGEALFQAVYGRDMTDEEEARAYVFGHGA